MAIAQKKTFSRLAFHPKTGKRERVVVQCICGKWMAEFRDGSLFAPKNIQFLQGKRSKNIKKVDFLQKLKKK